MRRPNIPETDVASQRSSSQSPDSVKYRTPVPPEDGSSVYSYTTRSSSLYVDPVKWNSTEFKKTTDKSKQLPNNVLGRGALLMKFKTKSKVGRDQPISSPSRRNGVNIFPIRKPFGRGTLMETVKNYHEKR